MEPTGFSQNSVPEGKNPEDRGLIQPGFWERPQQSTKRRRSRECWVLFRDIRLLSKPPLFDRNVYHHPVCKTLANSKCPWRLFYYFPETSCWRRSWKCCCYTYIIFCEAWKGCSSPLCHCVGAHSSDTADEQTLPETKSTESWEGRDKKMTPRAEHPSKRGRYYQLKTKALSSPFPCVPQLLLKTMFYPKNCIRLNILPGKFGWMWMEKIFITYILAPSRRSDWTPQCAGFIQMGPLLASLSRTRTWWELLSEVYLGVGRQSGWISALWQYF